MSPLYFFMPVGRRLMTLKALMSYKRVKIEDWIEHEGNGYRDSRKQGWIER